MLVHISLCSVHFSARWGAELSRIVINSILGQASNIKSAHFTFSIEPYLKMKKVPEIDCSGPRITLMCPMNFVSAIETSFMRLRLTVMGHKIRHLKM